MRHLKRTDSVTISFRQSLAACTLSLLTSAATCVTFVDGFEWVGLATGLALAAAVLWYASFGRPLDELATSLAKGSRPAPTLKRLLYHTELVLREEQSARARVDRLTRDAVEERRLQRDVMDNTVHELRTPLTTVISTIEMIRTGFLDDPVDTEELVEHAYSACHHMMFVINDLLDASAVRTGKLRLDTRPFPAASLMHNAKRILEPIAQVRDIGLHIHEPADSIQVLADEMRTLQVLFNLVGNALKYSEGNSSVDVTVHVDGDDVVFEVRDRGVGVPEGMRNALFERFVRVHEASESTASGTGIGLNFSKLMIERMDGSIGYRPRGDGAGSTFWFALPVADPVSEPLTT